MPRRLIAHSSPSVISICAAANLSNVGGNSPRQQRMLQVPDGTLLKMNQRHAFRVQKVFLPDRSR